MNFEDFFSKLWFSYPQDLCHGKKGSKHKATIAAKKLAPTQFEVILDNMEALKRFDKKDQKPDRWPHVSTFINQAYYDRDIGSTMELKHQIQRASCSICGDPVHGPNYDMCSHCSFQFKGDKLSERRKQILVDLNLYSSGSKVSVSELAKKCREYLKTNGGFGAVLAKMSD